VSGIAALFSLRDSFDAREIIGHMVESLAHRGPDGTGKWCKGPVCLGQQIMRPVPEDRHVPLPFQCESTGNVIVADARIDNQHELYDMLDFKGRACEEIDDVEFILRAYGRWAQACPQWLLGDFAFVIWDPNTRSLFCARDQLGARPFFYLCNSHHFACASEIKALLRIPGVSQQLNEIMVGDYLVPVLCDPTLTFYKGIFRLPPAHHITVHEHKRQIKSYWDLNPKIELSPASDEDFAGKCRELLYKSVQCRMQSVPNPGALLSGGLDSSSIVGVARKFRCNSAREDMPTFSAVFDRLPQCDERQFIQSVATGGGLNTHFIPVDQSSPLKDLEEVLKQQDEPFFAPNLFMHRELYGAASDAGVRVLLDGYGGDNVLGAQYHYLADLLLHGRLFTLAAEVRQFTKRYHLSMAACLFRHAFVPLVPDQLRTIYRMVRRRSQALWNPDSVIRPDFIERIGLADRMRQHDQRAPKGSGSLARLKHWQELTNGIIPRMFEEANRAAAYLNICPRYPFLDRRMVEFALALPPRQKLQKGWPRFILRQAMAGVLPEDIRWRASKSNISANFVRGVLEESKLSGFLDQAEKGNVGALGDYMIVSEIGKTCRRLREKRSVVDAAVIFRAIVLTKWLHLTGISA